MAKCDRCRHSYSSHRLDKFGCISCLYCGCRKQLLARGAVPDKKLSRQNQQLLNEGLVKPAKAFIKGINRKSIILDEDLDSKFMKENEGLLIVCWKCGKYVDFAIRKGYRDFIENGLFHLSIASYDSDDGCAACRTHLKLIYDSITNGTCGEEDFETCRKCDTRTLLNPGGLCPKCAMDAMV